jgi:glycine hydroxymethyltransferase
MKLSSVDPDIASLVELEEKRQESTLMLIPSENYASPAVREAVGSVLTNKYSEGMVGKRYYQGNKYIDEVEQLAIDRAKSLYKVPYVNVQAYSGSPANAAIYFALLQPGDTIMGLKLSAGGHLTHGHPGVTFSGTYYHSVQFEVNHDGYLEMDEVRRQVQETKPKLLMVGTTAYPRLFDWKQFRDSADSVGAYLVADVSHLSGLIAAGVIESPVPYADVVMMTTHKSLRGPRGAMILTTEVGLSRHPHLPHFIDKAIIPGLQGGPHNNVTAGIAVALKEADTQEFREYAQQVLTNATVLSESLMKNNFTLVTSGTDTHLMVVDLRPLDLTGTVVAEALEEAGIVTNRNSVPSDTNPPFYPSGIRLGTPAVTTRGMGEVEMKQIAEWIQQTVNLVKNYHLPEEKEKRGPWLQQFREEIGQNKQLHTISEEVKTLCNAHPLP